MSLVSVGRGVSAASAAGRHENELETFFDEPHLNNMKNVLQVYLPEVIMTKLEAKYGPLTGAKAADILRGALVANAEALSMPEACARLGVQMPQRGRPPATNFKITPEMVAADILQFLETTPVSSANQLSVYCGHSKSRINDAIKSLEQQGKIVVQRRVVDGHVTAYVARQGTNSTDPVGE